MGQRDQLSSHLVKLLSLKLAVGSVWHGEIPKILIALKPERIFVCSGRQEALSRYVSYGSTDSFERRIATRKVFPVMKNRTDRRTVVAEHLQFLGLDGAPNNGGENEPTRS